MPSSAGLSPDGLGEFHDAEHLGELIEDTILSQLGRMENGKFDAAQSVTNVQEPTRLPAPAVNRQGNAGNGLDAKAVQGCAENLVVVETGRQTIIQLRFIGGNAVHNSLVEVGGTQLPDLASESDVVAVVHLAEMIERAGLLGEG